VNWLIFNEYAENEAGIAQKLGYTRSSFSQLINGKVPLSDKFIEKLCEADKNINKVWILTGTGPMLKSDSPAIHNIYVEPSPEAQTSPKSPEPLSVDFALILERYENPVRENTLLKQTVKERDREIDDLKNYGSRPVPANPHPAMASPLMSMVVETAEEYK
jgi:transcriptional regulator with XRE-family HTH domain